MIAIPKHNEYLEVFLKKCPTADRNARFVVNLMDPEKCNVMDDSKKNTTRCCIMCSIPEDVARTKTRDISTPSYGTMDQQI